MESMHNDENDQLFEDLNILAEEIEVESKELDDLLEDFDRLSFLLEFIPNFNQFMKTTLLRRKIISRIFNVPNTKEDSEKSILKNYFHTLHLCELLNIFEGIIFKVYCCKKVLEDPTCDIDSIRPNGLNRVPNTTQDYFLNLTSTTKKDRAKDPHIDEVFWDRMVHIRNAHIHRGGDHKGDPVGIDDLKKLEDDFDNFIKKLIADMEQAINKEIKRIKAFTA